MKLTEDQIIALEYACSDSGGWPRAKANERSWVIRSYRALERRGLVEQTSKKMNDRIHFIGTPAGRALLASRDANDET